MAAAALQTEPDHDATGGPSGVPCIIGNEGCERLSFHGMKSILQVHLTALFVTAGTMDVVRILFATHASFYQGKGYTQ